VAVSDALRRLAGVIDEYEEGRVIHVETAERSGGTTSLTADIELPLSTDGASGGSPELVLAEATVDGDGTVALTLESAIPVSGTPDDVTVEPTDVNLSGEGAPTVTVAASVPIDGDQSTADGANGEAESVDDETVDDGEPVADGAPSVVESTGDRLEENPEDAVEGPSDAIGTQGDRDVPPFRDTELLREVYESCDTFAEMTEVLDMDVTAETVRRYMVDHGIHEPNSYRTGGDGADAPTADAEDDQHPPVVLPDGIGLPDDVTVDSFIETIKRSNTIYEVKRDVGIEQEDALEMLKELNLIDLVVGRLATEAQRDIRREEIIERLREASADQ
jgi:hypothetical protein